MVRLVWGDRRVFSWAKEGGSSGGGGVECDELKAVVHAVVEVGMSFPPRSCGPRGFWDWLPVW